MGINNSLSKNPCRQVGIRISISIPVGLTIALTKGHTVKGVALCATVVMGGVEITFERECLVQHNIIVEE
jgi:hypothetical protein